MILLLLEGDKFFFIRAQFRGGQRTFAGFCLPRSTSSQNKKMLSTMQKFCSSSARCLRPVVSLTSILTRNSHQAKAQAPSTTGSPSSGDYDLKLVNGKKTFSFTLELKLSFTYLFLYPLVHSGVCHVLRKLKFSILEAY